MLAVGDELVDFDELLARRSSLEARRKALTEEAHLPAETTDGRRLRVMVNVESLRDLDMFEPSNTDGLGLVRTEFLYMERPEFPSEDEQFRLYRNVLERMAPLPVTLRTLDRHLAVDATGAHECRVQHVRAVRRRQHDDGLIGLETVHFRQNLVQRLFALIVSATEPRTARTADSIVP